MKCKEKRWTIFFLCFSWNEFALKFWAIFFFFSFSFNNNPHLRHKHSFVFAIEPLGNSFLCCCSFFHHLLLLILHISVLLFFFGFWFVCSFIFFVYFYLRWGNNYSAVTIPLKWKSLLKLSQLMSIRLRFKRKSFTQRSTKTYIY